MKGGKYIIEGVVSSRCSQMYEKALQPRKTQATIAVSS